MFVPVVTWLSGVERNSDRLETAFPFSLGGTERCG